MCGLKNRAANQIKDFSGVYAIEFSRAAEAAADYAEKSGFMRRGSKMWQEQRENSLPSRFRIRSRQVFSCSVIPVSVNALLPLSRTIPYLLRIIRVKWRCAGRKTAWPI